MSSDPPSVGHARLVAGLLGTTDRCVVRPDAITPPLTLVDVATLLADGRARFPHVAMTLDGSPLPPSRFCSDRTINGTSVTGLLDPTKVERLLAKGASVVLNELDTYWPSLTRICEELRLQTGFDLGAMAFVSPPGCGAFPLHQDPVHVVVIQCAGVKDWVVFDHFSGQDEAGPVNQPEGHTPRYELTFEPGDVFSMPPGHPHRATSSVTWSLHISITVKRSDPLAQLKADIRSAVQQSAGIEDPTRLRAAVIEALTNTSHEPSRPTSSTSRGDMQERLLAMMRNGE